MIYLKIFFITFFAELGDKTQLAALLFSSDPKNNPYLVFIFCSLAIIVSTGLAVLLGSMAAKTIEFIPLKLVAGIGFIAIGVWSTIEHFRG
jgi:putative Ca2+/H+ antiporter (TMEM165/GDT1 family)